ncbi:sphingomyelin phosphodiesterase [Leptospira noguchii]|uniref:Sphingomyelin phosphodiesterase n=1 Tax=Leptospira noguchii TaxID=28182 RepID=M6V9N4_9LEPT|nr:sphingomyelin phosphodiesterase [Leptospira noguchii]EMO54137.1 sphingomyelin phosphodiesterase [Leptospira noguchii]
MRINKITNLRFILNVSLSFFFLVGCLSDKQSLSKDVMTTLSLVYNETTNIDSLNQKSASNTYSTDMESVKKAPVGIKILTHNIFMLPKGIANWAHLDRAKQIANADYIKNQDVIVFDEAFDTNSRKILLEGIRFQYPYQTDVIGRAKNNWDETLGLYRRDAFLNGGVVIVSKWPIEEKIQYIFNDPGCGADWLANKGFAYVRINKNGKKFHVIGTHVQAQDSTCADLGVSTRENQFNDIRNFIRSKNIPKDETVLIAGDLNVIKGSSEYFNMIFRLNVNEPKYIGVPYTWDTKTNAIAAYGFEKENPVYLDYILVSKSHAQPPVWQNLAYDPITIQTWTSFGGYTSDELSDHYPVYGFVYADSSTPTKSGHKRKYDQVSFQSASNGKFIQADPNRKDGWVKADTKIKTDFTKFNLLQKGNPNQSCLKSGPIRVEPTHSLNYFWNWWLGGGSGNYGYYPKFNDPSKRLEILVLGEKCLENGSKIVFKDYDTDSGGFYHLTAWNKGNWKEHLYLWSHSINEKEIFYVQLNSTLPKDWSKDLIYR